MSKPYGHVRLIGITGRGGAGKSEVAKILASAGWRRPHIGAPLKRMVRVLLEELDIPQETILEHIDGDLKRANIPVLERIIGRPISATDLQQTLGTEWGRDIIGEQLWLGLWMRRVETILAGGGKVLSESCRFPNEAEAIMRRGGIILEVRSARAGQLGDAHTSETAWRVVEPHVIIDNDGTIDELRAKVLSIF